MLGGGRRGARLRPLPCLRGALEREDLPPPTQPCVSHRGSPGRVMVGVVERELPGEDPPPLAENVLERR